MPGSTSGPTTRWLPTRSSVGIWAGAQEVDGGGSGREADLVGSGIKQRLDPPARDPTPRRGSTRGALTASAVRAKPTAILASIPTEGCDTPATPSRGLGPPL